MKILKEQLNEKWQFKDDFLVLGRKINREMLSVFNNNEIKLNKNGKKIEEPFFVGRKSYRGDMDCVSSEIITNIIETLTPNSIYRPTPLAGNIDIIKFIIYKNNICKLYSFTGDLLFSISKDDNDCLYTYIENQIVRNDIKGTGGDYLFPLLTTEKLKIKYGNMYRALSFTTLGCFIQNLTLVLNSMEISSCIHFGAKNYTEWNFNDEIYSIPCFIRFGYEKNN